MRYFNYLTPEEIESIFYSPPQNFSRDSSKDLLAYTLGATLYMPATKENIAEDIITKKNAGIMSMVICLEDAIGDYAIIEAEKYVCRHFNKLSLAIKNGEIDDQNIPLIFLRVRNKEQMLSMADQIGEDIKLLTGFVFPKFSYENGAGFFEALKKINTILGKKLYGMPIFETADIIYKETRMQSLGKIRNVLDDYNELVLNIRVGATDFSSLFGIRRGYDMTIYNIAVIRDCIADILNCFAREGSQYVISAPVWEYFSSGDRVLKPQLRRSPFEDIYGSEGIEIRKELLDAYLDGLIQEVLLDKANGFIGKTIIHPSHITPVQSLYVVSHEEYMDASSIIENNDGSIGVMKSQYKNKMNEIKPHLNWAKKIMIKSKIYGVYHERQNFTSLLTKKVYV
ncbi:HpcH/HpaI aldolase/citrate lyase family protein [Crassaminicella thermophila]|uniref:HpcH/HpaI aldolase/citrate lyase family protein n=1 Tax=Crassaminicella thermophila TaxID=2599308 RepID=A0A5C0SAN1_CRATE|nr:HpcH/HpaI aldolase/citrate lyase family protein [Crassaminicella thermophila]QEK11012.1 HpcH/HpaI aldolase/citrate lyase family protein [Crassaminicella thermophila]